ncbi:hypothetical protein F5Y01DRAFT_330328 [Xylaria sp. FL0043]|nr:hypothetical protein F5Y01DRAFT_330328 [Xylaria sp. FL0043]
MPITKSATQLEQELELYENFEKNVRQQQNQQLAKRFSTQKMRRHSLRREIRPPQLSDGTQVLPENELDDQQARGLKHTKIIIPIHLQKDQHWVIAYVKESCMEDIIYDSLPSPDPQREAQEKVAYWFAKFFNDHDPEITFTAPILQQNSYDCGILALVVAFYIAVDKFPPCRVDTVHWRRFLLQMLRPLTDEECGIISSTEYSDLIALDKIAFLQKELRRLMAEITASMLGEPVSSRATRMIGERNVASLCTIQQLKRYAMDQEKTLVVKEAILRLRLGEEYLKQITSLVDCVEVSEAAKP